MHPNEIFTLPDSVRGAGAVTLGVFDGVHRGHAAILDEVARLDPDRGLALTFRPHPDEVLWGRPVCWVAGAERNGDLIRSRGVSAVETVAFSPELSQVSAREFSEYLFFEVLDSPKVVLGFNQRFGHRGEGDARWLRDRFGDRLEVICVDPVDHEGDPVSSTRVREAVLLGELDRVTALLGRPYGLRGTVVRGFERGRQLGFPTANILPPEGQVLPPFGVYEVDVGWEGQVRRSVANLGIRPTFEDDDRPCLEVHVLDFDGDLYGSRLDITWRRFIRAERRFPGRQELVAQIRQDIAEVAGGTT